MCAGRALFPFRGRPVSRWLEHSRRPPGLQYSPHRFFTFCCRLDTSGEDQSRLEAAYCGALFFDNYVNNCEQSLNRLPPMNAFAHIANILLDRDGTIIYDRHYLADPAGVRLLPGAGKGLYVLSRAGCRLFLVTNQSGVGRGFFSHQDFKRVQAALYSKLQDWDLSVQDEAICIHAPEQNCTCRKPQIGLWTRLATKHGLKAKESLMIGDKDSDIAFARNAGLLGSILISPGHGPGQGTKTGQLREYGLGNHPSLIASDLETAAAWITAKSSRCEL